MKIICDTASMIMPKEAEELGIALLPLNVCINGKTYREQYDIDSKTFVDLVRKGGIPSSSQPAVGEVLEALEGSNEETLAITMADGLSGTYQTFEGVKQSIDNSSHIHILNSKTLCGPENLLVHKALALKKQGLPIKEIIKELQASIAQHVSYLMPRDFDFLRRGGRLSPLAATIGSLVKINPVLKLTNDGRVLEKFAIKRTVKAVVSAIADDLKKLSIDHNYTIFISHGDDDSTAHTVADLLKNIFPETLIKVLELTPAFITQGGPNCIAIQVIHN